ncbi:MAG: hypothetical protein NT154_28645 [Verrucomicrobia bacterium]|nr:hypothetical protein [Verrucomicrobiota bacterium]
MADALVLDTSACCAFLEDEAGADVVESFLVEAKEGRMVKGDIRLHPLPPKPGKTT